ncbi:tetratricopeptide repeat protein [Actinoplanes sp. NPDC089786]|uniref:tetratricopeptide repeat protein n=1 Tax=Actinoplanes sp. NPDC089786 TaxID=3155185 RepID=UPI00343DC622
MPPMQGLVDTFAALPDPGQAGTLDALVERLRLLKLWAGDPSYERIKDRVNTAWSAAGRPAGDLARKTTVADCFRPGRRRLNPDLVVAVVQALHPDAGYVTQWRQALQVIGGRSEAASQVRVQDRLPPDLAGFTGRVAELDLLRQALHHGQREGGAVVISAIAGMAGVGKTQLAIHAGHLLTQEKVVDRVLFVNLRGFHPDPAQPPADPGAVLDGFLRLLGVPGQQIPHDLPARTAAYRRRLAGTRTLVVLDNAATADQVRPLLPGTAGCPALVTSRRDLATLCPSAHLTVNVFTPDDALAFLTRAAAGVPVGADPGAAARIARRCGHLPLALGLVAAHIRGTPGWTLTDRADRLDERHYQRRLDTGVELALGLSYQQLPTDLQRVLRLLSLHPGQDLDAYAAAALADTDLPTAEARLHHLRRDHLLQEAAPGRYTLHDLVRAYAAGRAGDEDPPSDRRAALTRLFDFYLHTAHAGDRLLYPHRDPVALAPARAGMVVTPLTDAGAAMAWFTAEHAVLLAVAEQAAAAEGLDQHTAGLAWTLTNFLNLRGHWQDQITVQSRALAAARRLGDRSGQAHIHRNLGRSHDMMSRPDDSRTHFSAALALFAELDDQVGTATTHVNLARQYERQGRYPEALSHDQHALALFQAAGDQPGEARALNNVGYVHTLLGKYPQALTYSQQALNLHQSIGNRHGEATTWDSIGYVHHRLGQQEAAIDCYRHALTLYTETGDRPNEAQALTNLGDAHESAGDHGDAHDAWRAALDILDELGHADADLLRARLPDSRISLDEPDHRDAVAGLGTMVDDLPARVPAVHAGSPPGREYRMAPGPA